MRLKPIFPARKTVPRSSPAPPGRRRGSELVEGMMIMVPFFALVFLIVDTSYALFIRATLQYAVQQGVNYAATGGTGGNGQTAAVQSLISTNSLNLVSSSDVTIIYRKPDLSSVAGAGANAYGNVIEADVTYSFSPLAPLLRSGGAINLYASASAVILSTAEPTL
jgi:Flp pilus assembly protein TadG